MTMYISKLSSFEPIEPDDKAARQPDWNERVVMGVVTSMAVMIVAIIVVLMGFA
jgi:hypothetical protein